MNLDLRPQPGPPLELPAGVERFPVTACGSSGPCPVCHDCASDCAACVLCEQDACPRCRVPDLTPRTATMLVVAGLTLASDLRTSMLASPRPVFRHHLARAFDGLTEALERGDRPRPGSLTEQLCLHLMIRYATDLACDVGETLCANLPYSDYDYYFYRLYDTLLADDRHEPYVEETVRIRGGERVFDFDHLAEVVDRSGSSGLLFAPFEESTVDIQSV
ncbi:hypothetical protein [Amycolatopsis sp.]|uniref:hypothetical protein n=1 Tax=Amycolatopsis sp. TaxID=37632 RepID=UPI002C12A231|nr:hypothetical protein [Amycolatopsis sp.]HVV08163.1 hypothetical protein [Amycolatopsis sp.]